MKSRAEEIKEYDCIISNMIDKFYNIECTIVANNLSYIGMTKSKLENCKLRKFNHIKLIAVNGLYTGQLHFINDAGEYLMLPWCYIVSMVPCGNKEKNIL